MWSRAQRALAESLLHPTVQLVAAVSAVGPNVLDVGQRSIELVKDEGRAVPVLDADGVDEDFQNQTIGVHQQMTFASQYLLSLIVAAHSAPRVVRTLWLSMIASVGAFSRASRATSRRASWSLYQRPSSRQRALVIDDAPRRQVARHPYLGDLPSLSCPPRILSMIAHSSSRVWGGSRCSLFAFASQAFHFIASTKYRHFCGKPDFRYTF